MNNIAFQEGKRLVLDGHSLADAAKLIDVNQYTLRYNLRIAGVRPTGTQTSLKRIKKFRPIVALRAKNMSYDEIEQELGCSRKTISSAIKWDAAKK